MFCRLMCVKINTGSIKMERVLSFGMTIFNIGERAKTKGMIFVQSILVTYYGLNLELGR